MIDKIKEFHRRYKAFKASKEYLSNGFYRYKKGNFIKSKFCFPFFIILSKNKEEKYTKINVKVGKWSNKDTISIENSKVILFHYSRKQFRKINFNLIEKFNYPHMDILKIDEKKNLMVAQYIPGPLGPTDDNVTDFLKELIVLGSTADIGRPTNAIYGDLSWFNYNCYLQHGDTSNFITNENKFIFIDLDTLSYRPALYDLINLILIKAYFFNLKDCWHYYESDYFDNLLIESFKLKDVFDFKDECLKAFIISRLNIIDRDGVIKKSDYLWINKVKNSNFQLSKDELDRWIKTKNLDINLNNF